MEETMVAAEAKTVKKQKGAPSEESIEKVKVFSKSVEKIKAEIRDRKSVV